MGQTDTHKTSDAHGMPVAPGPRAILGVPATIALIVGIVIGAGIFKAPAMVAQMTPSPAWMFGAWILGGVISLAGALCYAEIATAYAHAGGDYHFLHRAYGRSVAFLFAWARFSVITTGSIALLGFVFGDYMTAILPLPGVAVHWSASVYAALSIAVLSWINLRGIRTGSIAQIWLTLLEIGGLLLIVIAAITLTANGDGAAVPAIASASPGPQGFGMAMVFVLLTYGGWNEAAYISAEIKDRQRNIVRTLVISIVIISTLYLLVTWAYWAGLGQAGMSASEALAADLLQRSFGSVGSAVISALIAIAALTSINATIIVGARSNYAVGRDWPALATLARWDALRSTPDNAMRMQGAAALLLVWFGGLAGSGFKSMVEFTAPVFWLFFLLSGLSLFVLRWREPDTERPFKVPLFPFLPLLFCASCVFMLWSSLTYVNGQSLNGLNAAWIGVLVLAAGAALLPALMVASRRIGAPSISPPAERNKP